MDHAALHEFLSRFRYGVVSSLSAAGTPQSALVGIAVTAHLEIVFDTLRSTRKYANLIHDRRCSMVIGWDGEQTVQLEGIAEEPQGAELARCRDAYFAAWPDGRSRLSWPGLTHFVVRPTWVRYSDYANTPPLIDEMEFHPSEGPPSKTAQEVGATP